MKKTSIWFHGSPEKFNTLLKGSWVTPYKGLARAFSHRPSRICSADDDCVKVKHNGTLPGYLYIIAEEIREHDLTLLPNTDNTHWQTNRDLKVSLVEDVPVLEDELITEEEMEELRRKYPDSGTGYRSSKED